MYATNYIRHELRIIKKLKKKKKKFYVVPDEEIRIRDVTRGLSTSANTEEIKENLTIEVFTIIKVSQLKKLQRGEKKNPLIYSSLKYPKMKHLI